MSKMEQCRLCANVTEKIKTEQLFERNQRKLLRQIEELIGRRLQKTNELPQQICKICEELTLQAHAFRERCIQTQQHFLTKQKSAQNKKHKTLKVKVELPIKDGALSESRTLVEINQKEERTNNHVTLPLADTIDPSLIHESMSSENFLANDDDYNSKPFFVDLHTTNNDEGGDDIIKIKSETILIAACVPSNTEELPAQNKKPRKPYCRRPFVGICEVCGKHFKNASGFERHKRMHLGIRPFQCDQCPKSFMLKPELRIHMRNHTGEKPYACSYCEHRFKDCSSKIIHERYHTNVRPFACDRCDKAFTKSSHLKRHILAHTGERKYECFLCNLSFPFTKNLNQHFTTLKHKQNLQKQQKLENKIKAF